MPRIDKRKVKEWLEDKLEDNGKHAEWLSREMGRNPRYLTDIFGKTKGDTLSETSYERLHKVCGVPKDFFEAMEAKDGENNYIERIELEMRRHYTEMFRLTTDLRKELNNAENTDINN